MVVWLYTDPRPFGDEYHEKAIENADVVVDQLLRWGRPIDTPFLRDVELSLFTALEARGREMKQAEATANYHVGILVERALAAGIPDFRSGGPADWDDPSDWDEGVGS